MDDLINFEEWPTAGGHSIGVATMIRERSLNSLRLETIDQLLAQFTAWQENDDVACIVLNSSTDRAFCAGADIAALYHSISDAAGGDNPYGDAFFTHEYELDYAIHQCAKPVLAWGQGIVMGGGMGLLGGCSHRVGTPQTRLAMPEITIGLFPDAGGTWTLSRMRSRLGIFMGLTGCQISAGDAFELGLLNHIVDPASKEEVLAGLKDLNWSQKADANRDVLTGHLAGFELDGAQPFALLDHEAQLGKFLDECAVADDFLNAFEAGVAALSADEWFQQAISTYRNGSPTTARIFMEQMQRAQGMTLAETFQMELVIACQCIRHADFPEGVRALLIDKDKDPHWACSNVQEVPDSLVAEHFVPAWKGPHPLQFSA